VEKEETGTIRFIVSSAKILKKQDTFGQGDPYVRIVYNGEERKTAVIKDTRNPKWDYGI
jgi:Ca2+-dependent lipid-binding protein